MPLLRVGFTLLVFFTHRSLNYSPSVLNYPQDLRCLALGGVVKALFEAIAQSDQPPPIIKLLRKDIQAVHLLLTNEILTAELKAVQAAFVDDVQVALEQSRGLRSIVAKPLRRSRSARFIRYRYSIHVCLYSVL